MVWGYWEQKTMGKSGANISVTPTAWIIRNKRTNTNINFKKKINVGS